MILKGKLCLNQKDDYTLFSGGRLVSLTEYLNLMLLEDVHMTIKNMYDKKVIIDVKGKLIKDKVSPKFYLYHINGVNVDQLLWDLVGLKLEIELKNVSAQLNYKIRGNING